jgi:hypothetical protein
MAITTMIWSSSTGVILPVILTEFHRNETGWQQPAAVEHFHGEKAAAGFVIQRADSHALGFCDDRHGGRTTDTGPTPGILFLHGQPAGKLDVNDYRLENGGSGWERLLVGCPVRGFRDRRGRCYRKGLSLVRWRMNCT